MTPHRHGTTRAQPAVAGGTAPPPLMLPEDIQECIAACVACHAICLQTAYACLKMGGTHAASDHIRALLDCAELCQSAVHFMFAESSFQSRVCALCAEACHRCAETCHAMDSAQHDRCAKACECCIAMLHRARPTLQANAALSDGW